MSTLVEGLSPSLLEFCPAPMIVMCQKKVCTVEQSCRRGPSAHLSRTSVALEISVKDLPIQFASWFPAGEQNYVKDEFQSDRTGRVVAT